MIFFICARIEDWGFYQALSLNPEPPNMVMIDLKTALWFYECLCDCTVPVALVVSLYPFFFSVYFLFLNFTIDF